MQKQRKKYYPSAGEAVHLLVLYLVLQSLIDFPLALIDYLNDTNYLRIPWINFLSNVSIISFIFWFGYRKANNHYTRVFALKLFNPLIIVIALLMLPGLQYIVGLLNVQVLNVLPAPPWFWELFERVLESHFGFWGILLKVVIIAPLIEETLFRGIIMHGLMRNYRSWYAILLSGVMFSIFHLNPWQMTYTFFLGLMLGWLMIRTRSLPLCFLVHALNNLLVLLAITYHDKIAEYQVYEFSNKHYLLGSIGIIVIGITLITLLTLKRKKKNPT